MFKTCSFCRPSISNDKTIWLLGGGSLLMINDHGRITIKSFSDARNEKGGYIPKYCPGCGRRINK